MFASPALRRPDAVAANRLGQPGLWPYAISGDRPIVLVRVAVADDGSLVRQVVRGTPTPVGAASIRTLLS